MEIFLDFRTYPAFALMRKRDNIIYLEGHSEKFTFLVLFYLKLLQSLYQR